MQDSPSAPVRACPWPCHPSGKPVNDTPLYFTPSVVTSDGQRHDRFEGVQQQAPAAVQDVMACEFSERYEVVPGEWHFMAFLGGRKLAEQRFDVG